MIAMNLAVALVFAGGYAAIALSGPRQRGALWFAACYLLGGVAPVCDILIAVGLRPAGLLEAIGFTAFLTALLLAPIGFAAVNGRRPPWGAALAILFGGVALRAAIWSFRAGTFSYALAYQMPFAMAALLMTGTIWRVTPGQAWRGVALGLAIAMTVQFLLKPFFYAPLGGGGPLEDYTRTPYSIVSLGSTGILMLASGVVLLVMTAQRAIEESEAASETDVLSGLANRRGFDRQARAALARADATGARLSAVMFDLDHFKAINDRFGHDAGDAVIARFAALLRRTAPSAAVIGRMGGEEFAMLLEGVGLEGACLHAEAIRIRTADEGPGDVAVTVSGGVAEWRTGEPLADLMRRADKATYRAKAAGRNAIHGAPAEPGPALRMLAGSGAVTPAR